ncbi:PREDICTED: uncharacterized protein LOC106103856 [Papilio polytes]|uniref:uncharacterized protein LOC106103856 n=1 Tax=Papilio polytes TaxID=76194 RepID=UPI000675C75A|nr:PREDICTED: uncharacterized protein LOC106103856 [Papilio polytes]
MTILIYDYCELEERASRHLNAWKAWHLVLYSVAGIFGILNYVFLQETMQLVDNNCVLRPRELAFRMVELPNNTAEDAYNFKDQSSKHKVDANIVTDGSDSTSNDETNKNKRQAMDIVDHPEVEEENVTMLTGNETHRLMLDTSRTLFARDNDCQFVEYMPIMSTVFAAVWITFFTMCPGGGHSRSGLQRPWRIVAPALIFSLVLVGLTGHSFIQTNSGIQDFCVAFFNVTNTTTCSGANGYVERGVHAEWGLGGRAGATRAASAGVWASWACGAALLLARCLSARDFVVKRTAVYLAEDPQQKITPYLKKTKRRKSSPNSPIVKDNVSIRSEPTATTELVTASIDPGQETTVNTPEVTPVKRPLRADIIEMTNSPQLTK